jgi:light-regulated signal transduction histidine kinase (bacteriophytochrome)
MNMETRPEFLAEREEKARNFEDIQRATLNILEDFDSERKRLEQVQSATLNLLEDFDAEKRRQEDVQRATLNILDDFNSEKDRSEQSQRALLNILEDIDVEKNKVAEVNQRLETVNRELEHRSGELETTNKELEAFTYSVSHDLRAPLRHIDGFSRLLLEDHSKELSEEAQRLLGRVRQGTQLMGALVDDLLNLSRVSRREVASLVTDLNALVEEVLAELRPTFQGRQVECRVDRLPFAQCDPGLVRQVFTNLLANAIKFTRRRERAVIEVDQTRNDGHVAVFIRDNGVGFSVKYAAKLFGVFQRLHRPEDFEGTGVGLATVQRIIQKHGGRVWVEAEIDKGATFYFTLEGMEDAQASTTEIAQEVGSKKD